jgi:hypothetical protein
LKIGLVLGTLSRFSQKKKRGIDNNNLVHACPKYVAISIVTRLCKAYKHPEGMHKSAKILRRLTIRKNRILRIGALNLHSGSTYEIKGNW